MNVSVCTRPSWPAGGQCTAGSQVKRMQGRRSPVAQAPRTSNNCPCCRGGRSRRHDPAAARGGAHWRPPRHSDTHLLQDRPKPAAQREQRAAWCCPLSNYQEPLGLRSPAGRRGIDAEGCCNVKERCWAARNAAGAWGHSRRCSPVAVCGSAGVFRLTNTVGRPVSTRWNAQDSPGGVRTASKKAVALLQVQGGTASVAGGDPQRGEAQNGSNFGIAQKQSRQTAGLISVAAAAPSHQIQGI